LQTEINCKCC